MNDQISALVTDFVSQLVRLVEADMLSRVQSVLGSAVAPAVKRGPGRPRKNTGSVPTVTKKTRKRPPRQVCPIPGCKGTAAPIFGMVCAEHKHVNKKLVREFRDRRRAEKNGEKVALVTKSQLKLIAKSAKAPKIVVKPAKAKTSKSKAVKGKLVKDKIKATTTYGK